jgi:hypothetical protein
MKTPHLARVGYVSALRDPLSRGDLDALLSTWRRRNAQRGITGLVLYDAGTMFQVVEGFPEDVVRLYETIGRDSRHRVVARLIHAPASERAFGDWSMGLGRLTTGELGVLPALAALAAQRAPGLDYTRCTELMAEAILEGFTSGPWRRLIG